MNDTLIDKLNPNQDIDTSKKHLSQTTPLPTFDEWNMPEHYKRSGTTFTGMKLKELEERGFNGSQLKSMLAHLPHGAIIAGGAVASAILGEDINDDIDIFFTDNKAFVDTYNLLQSPPDKDDAWGLRGYQTDTTLNDVCDLVNAKGIRYVKWTDPTGVKKPIQMIKLLWYTDAEHVIDSFDFTVCQFALHEGNLTYNHVSMMDLLRKQINVHRLQFPTTSLRRLIKYTNKGYYASPNVLIKIAESMHDAVKLSPDEFATQEYT